MYTVPFNTSVKFAPYVKGHCFQSVSSDGSSLVYEPDEVVSQRFTKMPGQITRDSPFGHQLYLLARNGPRMWIEIGTWNGLGSTQAVLDGFAERLKTDRLPPKLASVEIDPVLLNAAAENLKAHPAKSCVEFYSGKLMPYSGTAAAEFPTPAQLGDAEQRSPHFFIHYDRERNLYANAEPFLPPFFPEVAVLDGGEYSGYLDWLHLQKTDLQYLCLDDTHVLKNKRVISELGPEWTCMVRGEDRNGWAIYKRV